VRRLYAIGDEQSLQAIRRHCVLWRADYEEVIAEAASTQQADPEVA
jgi:hypothetical protein